MRTVCWEKMQEYSLSFFLHDFAEVKVFQGRSKGLMGLGQGLLIANCFSDSGIYIVM